MNELSPRMVALEQRAQSLGFAIPPRGPETITFKIEHTKQPHIKIVHTKAMTPPEKRARNPILGYYIYDRVEVNCQTMTARTVEATSHLEDRKPYAACPIDPDKKHMNIPYFNSASEIKPGITKTYGHGVTYSNAVLNVCGTMDDVRHLLPQDQQPKKKKLSDWLKF